jgi:hypothetical protein
MALNQSDILQHNNPDLAVVDSDFTKGGFRTAVATVNDLYALSGKTDLSAAAGQLKEYATIVYVSGETKYYVLTDIDNVGNASGWSEFQTETITGATNGLTKDGQDVKLGGTNALTEGTSILGGSQNLSLGTAGNKLDEFGVNASGNLSINSDANLVMSLSGGTITTTDTQGLRYAADYTSSFVDESLVSKCYVDTVATGLHPHDVVLVATTANITLSNEQTIDGVGVVDGDRVLVKDQTTGSENGIYVVASGAWSRADDFDGNPTGEVVNGDLIPVESGDTHANTIWVLTTPDPITVGTDPLNFTLFSRLLGVSAGDGIEITPEGSTQQIAVDLATNSGLCIASTELRVDDAIAGSGLTWNSGVIDANVYAGSIAGTAIGVKLDGTGDLAVDSDDIASSIATPTPSGTLISVYDNSGALVVQAADIQEQMTGVTAGLGITDNAGTFDVNITNTTKTGNELDVKIDSTGNDTLYIDSADITNDNLVAAGGGTIGGTPITLKYNGNDELVVDSQDIQEQMTGVTAGQGLTDNSGTFDVNATGTATGTRIDIALDGSDNLVIGGNEITATIGESGPAGNVIDVYDNGGALVVQESDIQAAQSGYTFTNGLTETSGTVCLGGTLDNNTEICLNGSDICIGTDNDRTHIYTVYNVGSQPFVEIAATDLSNCLTTLTVRDDKIEAYTENSSFCGFTYVNGFASAVSNKQGCSIPDVDWVTGCTSSMIGASANTFTNGLCETSGTVCLGGTLTDDIFLTGDNNQIFDIGCIGSYRLNVNDENTPNFNFNVNGAGVVSTGAKLENQNSNAITSITFEDTLKLENDTTSIDISGTTVGITGALEVSGTVSLDSVAAGSETDDVLTITSGGEVQKISASSLGEDNNVYDMTIVTSDVTLTTGSTYVQLVNSPSSGITITLPATPIDGQVFRIKDAAGAALTYGITVEGNGNNIDGGSTPASLNTDGGALELVYNNTLGSWYVFSFVN